MQHFVKSSLLILALGVGSATFAQAPDQTQQTAPPAMHHHQPNPAREARMLAKKLGLTADQTAQITPILADRQQRMQALMSNTSLDPKSMHQQRRAIRMDTQQKLNAVLTPAQQQQLAALRAAHRHAGKQPTSAPPAATL
jgi:Spy/CpxP family protein refolding chaperone